MSQELPKNTLQSIVEQINKFGDQFQLNTAAVNVTSYRQEGKYVRVFYTVDKAYGLTEAEKKALKRRYVPTHAVIPDPFADGGTGPVDPVDPEDVKVTSFKVTGPASIEVGKTGAYVVDVAPTDATDKTYKVAVSKEGVVEVLNNGTILKALKADTVKVTYTANGGDVAPVVIDVTVTPVPDTLPTSVTMNLDKTSGVPGTVLTPTINVLPAGTTNKAVTLVTSNAAIVKVVGDKFEIVAEGTADVHVTCDAKPTIKSAAVTVTGSLP